VGEEMNCVNCACSGSVWNLTSEGRHPEAPRFHQWGEESRVESTWRCARDPSLRLKSGSAQDDISFRFRVNQFALMIALFISNAALAQTSIPAGTVLPLQLSTSLNSRKSRPGDRVRARIMQEVPLSSGRKIHAGAKVVGHVVSVKANEQPAEITFRFEKVESGHRAIPIITNLRALASVMAVEDAQIPSAGPDRGTPWAWTTKNLIGGEVAYGEGGPVVHGADVVGHALFGGVLAQVNSSPGSPCRGEVADNDQLQAFWVFSSDACGLYGIDNLEIVHAGRTPPVGEITFRSKTGNLKIDSGSGMLLRVTGSIGE